MKKKLYLLSVSALSFMVCSCQSDVAGLDKQSKSKLVEVQFSATINQSRAVGENFELDDQIGIYMVESEGTSSSLNSSDNYVDNRLHTLNGEACFVATQPVRCDETQSYDYFAYYPYSEANVDAKSIKFGVQLDQSTQAGVAKSDFLYSKLSSFKGKTVSLPFEHKLSLLKFNLKLPADVTDLADVKMTILNVNSGGSVDLASGVVETHTETRSSITPLLTGTVPTKTLVAQAIVAPQVLSAGVAVFTVEIGGTTYVYKPEEDITTSSGMTREFNITLTAGAVFDVVVFPEMKTYLSDGTVTVSMFDHNANSPVSKSAKIITSASETKLSFVDVLTTGRYTIHSVKYTDETVVDIETDVQFTTGVESQTQKFNESLLCFGEGTSTQPYSIVSGMSLRKLAEAVNASEGAKSFANEYFVMKKDVDLVKTQNWIPIGTKATPFKGNFDGGNFKISGLNILSTTSSDHFKGFFGYVDGTGNASKLSLKNLHFVSSVGEGEYDINISVGTATFYVGSLVGCIRDNVLVDNCSSSLKIFANSATGGLVGGTGFDEASIKGTFGTGSEYADVTVRNCHFTGVMQLLGGKLDGIDLGYAGGIVGRNHGLVQWCSNSGNLTASSSDTIYEPMGGIVGGNGGTVKECYNSGTLAAGGEGTAAITGGGIVGMPVSSNIDGVMLKSYISDCYNTGNVTFKGNNGNGGILGRAGGSPMAGMQLDRCYHLGDAKGAIFGSAHSTIGLLDIQFCITNKTPGYAVLQSTDYSILAKPGTRNLTGTVNSIKTGLTIANLRITDSKSTESNIDMKKQATYTRTVGDGVQVTWNWDFTKVWTIEEGVSYPTLRNNPPR